jgi:hypothetical protein
VAGLPIPASDLTSRLLRRLGTSTLVISDPLHDVPGPTAARGRLLD